MLPKKILIVGSGTGNDTAAAIQSGVKSVDAVEIDPVIIELGKKYHPENPYQNKKVNVIQNDARNFIRHTNEKYDCKQPRPDPYLKLQMGNNKQQFPKLKICVWYGHSRFP